MEQSTSAHDLRIRFTGNKAVWIGARYQLEEEGFAPPPGEAWPTGRKYLKLELGQAWACIYLVDATSTTSTADTMYRVHHYSNNHDYIERTARKKIKEAAALLSHGGSEWHKTWELHYKARGDDKFQDFKRKLLGQKKRGRKPGVANQRKAQA